MSKLKKKYTSHWAYCFLIICTSPLFPPLFFMWLFIWACNCVATSRHNDRINDEYLRRVINSRR